jgi:hypothetical protein
MFSLFHFRIYRSIPHSHLMSLLNQSSLQVSLSQCATPSSLSCLSFSLYPFFCFVSCLSFRTCPQSSPDILSLFLITSYSYSDWLRAGRLRSRSSSPDRVKNLLFSTASRPALGSTQPPLQWVPTVLSSWVKRPGHEADHSLPISAEVRKCVSIYPLSHMPSWYSA